MRNGKKVLVIVVLVCLGAALAAEAPDAIPGLIDQGRKAYEKQDYQRALDAFQQVVSELQKRVGRSLEAFFPAPPEGWTASEISTDSFSAATQAGVHRVTTVKRTYTRTADKQKVSVTLTNMPDAVRAMRQGAQVYKNLLASNPAARNPNENVKIEERGAWTVFLREVKAPRPEAVVHAMTDVLMLLIEARGADEALVNTFLSKFDLKGLAAAAPPAAPAGQP